MHPIVSERSLQKSNYHDHSRCYTLRSFSLWIKRLAMYTVKISC